MQNTDKKAFSIFLTSNPKNPEFDFSFDPRDKLVIMKTKSLAFWIFAAVFSAIAFLLFRYTHEDTYLFAVGEARKTDHYIMLTANKNGFAGHASLVIEKVGMGGSVPFGLRPQGSAKKGLLSFFSATPATVANDSYNRPDPTCSPTIALYLTDDQADRLLSSYKQDRETNQVTYQLGTNDCVSFSKAIAQELGLKVPASILSHIPKYYLIEMIKLNLDKLTLTDTHHARAYFPSRFSNDSTGHNVQPPELP